MLTFDGENEEVDYANNIPFDISDDRNTSNKDTDRLSLVRVRDRLFQNEMDLYQEETLVTFRSLEVCSAFLRIFRGGFQKTLLSGSEDKNYDYLNKIKISTAPFLDDIRWENIRNMRRNFYVKEYLTIIIVSALNFYLEYHYATTNIKAVVLSNDGYRIKILFRLGSLLMIQLAISVVTVLILEKMIISRKYLQRSQLIESQFLFYNFFMIITNIIIVFYGFWFGALTLRLQTSKENIKRLNYFVSIQWIKNSAIVCFLPLLQRLLGDFVGKAYIVPFLEEMYHKYFVSRKERRRLSSMSITPILESEVEKEAPGFSKKLKKSKSPNHDFGLNSSYIVQIMFFTGFYLPLATPLLQLISTLGIIINYVLEKFLIRTYYRKTKYLNIGSVVMSLRYGFIAFCIGGAISIQNSTVYSKIIEERSFETNLDDFTNFGHLTSFCMLFVSFGYFFQIKDNRIMMRILVSITRLPKRFQKYFFQESFYINNYKEQNPFYTLERLDDYIEQ